MLSMILSKRFNYESEGVDRRAYAPKGIETRQSEFDSMFAAYYGLIIGSYPNEATRRVAEGAVAGDYDSVLLARLTKGLGARSWAARLRCATKIME